LPCRPSCAARASARNTMLILTAVFRARSNWVYEISDETDMHSFTFIYTSKYKRVKDP
jgi:hypothetical protein